MNRVAHNRTHNMTGTAEYSRWNQMKRRCYTPTDPKFPKYGGRGIGICKRWRKDFDAFMKDMGPRPSSNHSIDRIDNDWHYEPSNCRWATPREQAANTNRNLYYTYDGRTQHLADWCRELNIKYTTLYTRLNRGGMTFVEAIK